MGIVRKQKTSFHQTVRSLGAQRGYQEITVHERDDDEYDPELDVIPPFSYTKKATVSIENLAGVGSMSRGDSNESLLQLAENTNIDLIYERIDPEFAEFKSWFLKIAYIQLKAILEDYLKDPTINVQHLMENVSPFDVPPQFKQINLTEENRKVLLLACKKQMQIMIDKMKENAEDYDKESSTRKKIGLKMKTLDTIY